MGRARVLETIARIHQPGYYCFAACLRDILEYYGHRLSFNMAFGLLGGVAVYYVRSNLDLPYFMPLLWLAGDPGLDPTDHLCKALGIYRDSGVDADADAAWERSVQSINRGQPVMIDVVFNHRYIEHLNIPTFIKKNLASMQPTSVFDRTPSGGQRCLLYGYDLDQDVAYHLEPVIPGPNLIPIPVLKQLRSGTDTYFPPQNRWSVFYVPPGPLPLRRAVQESIRLTAQRLLNPPVFAPLQADLGLPGLANFVREVGDWPAIYPEPLVRDSLQALYVVIRSIGRGQFRGFYAGFLTEAAALLAAPELLEVAGEYRRLARLWESVGTLALTASLNPAVGLTGVSAEDRARREALLGEILERESTAAEGLAAFAGGRL